MVGTPNRASSAAIRRSQAIAIPSPPPIQNPRIEASVGFATASSRPTTRSMRSSYSIPACGLPRNAGNWPISVPEMNARSPLPRITRTLIASSRSTCSQVSTSRWYIAQVIALRCSGRLTVRYATPRLVSKSISDDSMRPPPRSARVNAARARGQGFSVPEAGAGRGSVRGATHRGVAVLGRTDGNASVGGRAFPWGVGRGDGGGGDNLAEQLPRDVPDRHTSLIGLGTDIVLDPRPLTFPGQAPEAQDHAPFVGADVGHERLHGLSDLEDVGDLLHPLLGAL